MSKRKVTDDEVRSAIATILSYVGDDHSREGLKETPERVRRSWSRIFGGYQKEVKDVFTVFQEDDVVPHGQIILLKDIELYSTCEHHFLPITGKAHVAYIPTDKVIGISKLARILEIYSRRLQVQERIGNQVTQAIMDHLGAKGAACIIEAKHACMTIRGVEKQHSSMVTSSLRGTFLSDPKSRAELMQLIRC